MGGVLFGDFPLHGRLVGSYEGNENVFVDFHGIFSAELDSGGIFNPLPGGIEIDYSFHCCDNLVAYWSFDDQDNPGFDEIDNGSPLQSYGATWTSNGHIGGAMSFDGVNDYMETSTEFTVNTGEPRTVSAWVYLRSTGVGRGIVMLPDYSYPNGQVTPLSASLINHSDSLSISGVFAFYNGPLGADVAQSGANRIQLNRWYHLAGVVENNTVRLYVDGSTAGTIVDNPGNANATVTSKFLLGVHYFVGNWDYLNGLIDEVRIYNRALSQAEIECLASQ